MCQDFREIEDIMKSMQAEDSNIRDFKKFISNVWNWKPFFKDFPCKISPTDIDGVIFNRQGHFLFIEAKLPGNFPPAGQWQVYEHLLRLGCCTLFIVYGQRNAPEKLHIYYENGSQCILEDIDEGIFAEKCLKWWNHCNAAQQSWTTKIENTQKGTILPCSAGYLIDTRNGSSVTASGGDLGYMKILFPR